MKRRTPDFRLRLHSPCTSAGPGRARRFAMIVPLLLGCLLALPALAQNDSLKKESEAPVEPAAKVPAIPIGDVGIEAPRTKRVLAETTEALLPEQQIREIRDELPSLAKRVAQQVEESARRREDARSVTDLDSLVAGWKDITTVLDALQAKLRARGNQVASALDVVKARRAAWAATREAAVEQQVGREVLREIEDVQAAIERAQKDATRRQADIIELQSQVAANSEIAAGDLKRIDTLRNTLIGEVFGRDQPPIWSPQLWRGFASDRVGSDLVTHQAREEAGLQALYKKHSDWVLAHLIIGGLFTLVVFASRNAIRSRIAANVNLESLGPVFARPISLSLVIVVVVALLTAPVGSSSLRPLLGTAALIPSVLVLRRLIEPSLFPILNGVMIAFFLSQLGAAMAPVPAVARAIFLFEMALYAVLCTLWLRPSRLSQIPPKMRDNPVIRASGHGLKLVAATSFLAIGFDFAGFGSLSRLIGWTLVVATYAAVVLYGASRAIDGFVALLLAVRPLNLLGMVRRNNALLRRRVMGAVNLGLIVVWGEATLRNAEMLDNVEEALDALFKTALPLPEIEITVGDLAVSALTFYVATLISRFVLFALEEDVFSRINMREGRPYAISALIHYVFLFVGFLLAVAALGFDANRFTLLAGAFGVGIGFGLQNIVNNFTSGLILLTERPVEVGDTISMGEVFGRVSRIGIRSSTVRTWQGAEVIVPNADLISLQVTNWTLSDKQRRIEIPIGVAYGTDPRRVIEILQRVASADPRILANPEPNTLFLGFGDSSLDFELRAWTEEFDSFMGVRSDLCVGIEAALGEAGITIPFPQRDLHIKGIATEEDPPPERPKPRVEPEAGDGETG